MYRQGDVLIVKTSTIPTTAIRQARCIIAHGEVTGHCHQIMEAEAFMWTDTDGTKYVEVNGDTATVTHEEHGSITLKGPAMYRIIQQREYTPQEIRHVKD